MLLPAKVTMAILSPRSFSSRSLIAILARSSRLGFISSASIDREVSSKITMSLPLVFISKGLGFHLGSVSAMTITTKAQSNSNAFKICLFKLTATLIFLSISTLAKTFKADALRQKHHI